MNKTYADTQGDKPKMQHGWEGRGGLIVIKDAVVVETDLLWQTVADKGSAENQLIVLCVGMCRMQTRQAVNLHMTEHTKD